MSVEFRTDKNRHSLKSAMFQAIISKKGSPRSSNSK
jgi:hypothetical protein